jgi:hypothetical protein
MKDRVKGRFLPAANDNGECQVVEGHLSVVACAVGRHIARTYLLERRGTGLGRPANDNQKEEEGKKPEG